MKEVLASVNTDPSHPVIKIVDIKVTAGCYTAVFERVKCDEQIGEW